MNLKEIVEKIKSIENIEDYEIEVLNVGEVVNSNNKKDIINFLKCYKNEKFKIIKGEK